MKGNLKRSFRTALAATLCAAMCLTGTVFTPSGVKAADRTAADTGKADGGGRKCRYSGIYA